MNSEGIILLTVGIFTLFMTIKKPKFYWESRKSKQMRALMGDKGASIFYLALALFLLFFGLNITFQIL